MATGDSGFWAHLRFTLKVLAVIIPLAGVGFGWAMRIQERVAVVETKVETDKATLMEIKSGIDKVNTRIDDYLEEVRKDAQERAAAAERGGIKEHR